jgi:hypothetical protein
LRRAALKHPLRRLPRKRVMTEFLDWLAGLDQGFAFLLALPFAIGALGLLAEAARRQGRGEAGVRRRNGAERRRHGSHLTSTGA